MVVIAMASEWLLKNLDGLSTSWYPSLSRNIPTLHVTSQIYSSVVSLLGLYMHGTDERLTLPSVKETQDGILRRTYRPSSFCQPSTPGDHRSSECPIVQGKKKNMSPKRPWFREKDGLQTKRGGRPRQSVDTGQNQRCLEVRTLVPLPARIQCPFHVCSFLR